MKVRYGFISNSSSSCFILDRRDSRVQTLIRKCLAPTITGLGRHTAIAVGETVVEYAQDVLEDDVGLSHWIMHWVEQLDPENIVFMRESDEGMCGYLFCEENNWDHPIRQEYHHYKRCHIRSYQSYQEGQQEMSFVEDPSINDPKNSNNPYIALKALTLDEREYD